MWPAWQASSRKQFFWFVHIDEISWFVLATVMRVAYITLMSNHTLYSPARWAKMKVHVPSNNYLICGVYVQGRIGVGFQSKLVSIWNNQKLVCFYLVRNNIACFSLFRNLQLEKEHFWVFFHVFKYIFKFLFSFWNRSVCFVFL